MRGNTGRAPANKTTVAVRKRIVSLRLSRARRQALESGTLGGTQENGTRITSLSRTFRDDVQELRIYLQEFEGNPMIQVGPWKCDEASRWFIVPTDSAGSVVPNSCT